ncbi:MAG: protein kinase [Chloroflexi bacterium]|nr:protein kinase [Chloroflexota bacterium]
MATSTDPLLGRTLGHYQVRARIGAGGMAVVYRAVDARSGQTVALKVLPPTMHAGGFRERFLRECELARGLRHPNIVRVFESGEHDDLLYLAMELVEGGSLDSLLARRRRLDLATTVRIAGDVAAGLDYAHNRRPHPVVHRDIKPGNVLLRANGQAVLADFGIAHMLAASALTATGARVGTPAYMAPEQVRGARAIDHRVDVWAFGVMLYEMLTGEKPFAADNEFALLRLILEAAPTPPRALNPALPRHVEQVILQALEKDVQRRPHSAGAVAALLAEGTEGATAARTGRRRGEQNAPLIAGIAIAALILGMFMLAGGPPNPPPATATLVRTVTRAGPTATPGETRAPTATSTSTLAPTLAAGANRVPTATETQAPTATVPATLVPTSTLVRPTPTERPAPTALVVATRYAGIMLAEPPDKSVKRVEQGFAVLFDWVYPPRDMVSGDHLVVQTAKPGTDDWLDVDCAMRGDYPQHQCTMDPAKLGGTGEHRWRVMVRDNAGKFVSAVGNEWTFRLQLFKIVTMCVKQSPITGECIQEDSREVDVQ